MDVGNGSLFAFVRAGGDPHWARSRHVRAELRDQRRQLRRRGDIEFEIAQRDHLIRTGAQRDEALGIVLRLRSHARDSLQRATDQWRQQPIATQRTRRQPRIEDVHRNLAVATTEQHVRP